MITIQDGPGLDGGPGSAQDAASPDVGTRHRVSAETQRGPGCGEHGPSHGGPDGKPVRARCPVCGKPRAMRAGWLAEHGPLWAPCEGSGLRVFPPTPFVLHDLRAVAS